VSPKILRVTLRRAIWLTVLAAKQVGASGEDLMRASAQRRRVTPSALDYEYP